MDVGQIIRYWIESADRDWPAVQHLVQSGDYQHALFFSHLYLEKLLKALVVRASGEHAPRTHNLLLLAERAGLALTEEQQDVLLRATGYSIETRYPDDVPAARSRYGEAYAEEEIETIRKVGDWLKSILSRETR